MRRLIEEAPLAVALSCLILVSLGVAPASASTFIALDMEGMVERSDAVVQGQVIEMKSFWDEEGRIIITEALVAVEEAIAGESDALVWVRTFGGQVGDFHVEAIGFPSFEVGERVVLFLNQRHGVDRSIRVTGYQQGHYRIIEKQGVEIAVPAVEKGVNLLSEKGQAAAPPQALKLDELKSEVDRLSRRLTGLDH